MMVERPTTAKSLTESAAPASTAPAGPPLPPASVQATAPPSAHARAPRPTGRWQAAHDLACHRAETERVKVLVDFLARPIHAHGGADPDPDIVTAYNLAVEAALGGIRRVAQLLPGCGR